MHLIRKITAPLRFLSKTISKIVTTVVLTLVYFFGIGPMSLLGKIFGKDFIGEKRRQTHSYWLHEKEALPTIENFKKLY